MTTMHINPNGFWENDTEIGHVYDTALCKGILSFLYKQNIKTLIDFGCGKADYCKEFIKHGIYCEAYDGNPHTPKLSGGIGKVLDLSSRINPLNQYDCVMSLEVGEHIPQRYESVFIDNLYNHAKKYILVSWAIPGQSGNGHVNCQTNSYIIDKMLNKNFIYDYQCSVDLRNYASLWWFKNTLMVFKKKINDQ